jgi:hypothetical protein
MCRGRGLPTFFHWLVSNRNNNNNKLKNSVALVRKGTIPTERPPLVGEVVPTFAGRGCYVVSATDSHGR